MLFRFGGSGRTIAAYNIKYSPGLPRGSALGKPLVRIQSGVPKTVSSNMLETIFICGKLGELKPDLTTTAHFAIQLSYYAMSYLQHPLQSRAGALFVLVEEISGVVAGVIDLPQSLEAAA